MKKVGVIFKIILVILLLFILAVNVSVIIQSKTNKDKVPKIFGYKPFVVLSGSMEPEIHVGDLILVKEIDTNTLDKDDIIAYRDNQDKVTTHRIVEVIKGDDGKISFITKGDANNTKDAEIEASQVEGKFEKRYAGLGNAIIFIQQPLGFAVVVLSIIIVCLLIYFNPKKKDIFESEEEKKAFEEFKKSRNKN